MSFINNAGNNIVLEDFATHQLATFFTQQSLWMSEYNWSFAINYILRELRYAYSGTLTRIISHKLAYSHHCQVDTKFNGHDLFNQTSD